MTAANGYSVYVIWLEPSALSEKDRKDATRGAVYVGYTSKSPAERLGQHQAAGRLSGRVFRRMLDPRKSELRPGLSPYAGGYPTEEEARRMERKAHNRLLSDGYTVFGDKGKKLGLRTLLP